MQGDTNPGHRRFAAFAWAVLAYNVAVILWGAYVRISFSGDGCGAHWPFCSGQLVPQNMTVPAAIEFTHRLMTGFDSIAVVAMCIWAFPSFPRRHRTRLFSLLSVVFLAIEALLGAGLVLFRKVAHDESMGRAWYLSGHLTNTLLLLGVLTVTAWSASRRDERWRFANVPRPLLGALPITLLISITGAIAALGDTLFPAVSLEAGMAQDFSSASSLLLRLRLVHPLIALLGAAYLIWMGARVLMRAEDGDARAAGGRVLGVTVFQLAAGMVNIALLAPVWMQLLHLFIADVLWITVVLLVLEEACYGVESTRKHGSHSVLGASAT